MEIPTYPDEQTAELDADQRLAGARAYGESMERLLESAAAERDQLRARVAELEALLTRVHEVACGYGFAAPADVTHDAAVLLLLHGHEMLAYNESHIAELTAERDGLEAERDHYRERASERAQAAEALVVELKARLYPPRVLDEAERLLREAAAMRACVEPDYVEITLWANGVRAMERCASIEMFDYNGDDSPDCATLSCAYAALTARPASE